MKIVITNNIALNGGDAAILFGMIKVLKNRFGADTEFAVSGSRPEVCKALYPEIEWCRTIGSIMFETPYNHIRVIGRLARLLKKLRYYFAAYFLRYGIPLYKLLVDRESARVLEHYAASDYIISSGGTYLIEPYGITQQYLDYKISLILKKPLIMYTQSMGPFVRQKTRRRMRKIFDCCELVLLRDKKSAQYVLDLGIKDCAKVQVVPDAAFALGDYQTMQRRESQCLSHYGNVAISVREWCHSGRRGMMENYRACIARIVSHLIDLKYSVHFISTCQGEAAYTDDNCEVEKILALLPPESLAHVVKYDRKLSLPEIQALLQQMDFVVATRLHMSIIALISGTPVFPIAYEFKTSELYHSLGYDDVIEMENLDATTICGKVDGFMGSVTMSWRHEINLKVKALIDGSINVPQKIKPKVLFFVGSFPCMSETFVLNQVVSAIRAGFDVRIYSWGKGDLKCTHEDIDRYDLLDRTWFLAHEIPTSHFARFLKVLPIIFRLCRRYGLSVLKLHDERFGHPRHSRNLVQYFIAERFARELWQPDVVVSHFGDNGLFITAMRNAGVIAENVRCLTFFHAHEICRLSIEQAAAFYRPIFNAIDVLLPISNYWERKLIQCGAVPEQVKVLRMGVDLSRFVFKEKEFASKGVLNILSVGRLVGQKGFEYAIRGVAEFCKRAKVSVRYMIIGAGPLKRKLEELVASLGVSEVISLVGAQPQQVVAAEMEKADIFLLPSVEDDEGFMEGIPVALMEAMAMGLICISTKHSGIPELIEDGISGCLCDERDAHGIAAALTRCLGADKTWQKEVRHAARQKVETEFDVVKETKKLFSLIS